ncbi:MAG: alpha/beta fold hydrolase [Ardenticatenaceae bacterium]|nr:alpha/beta fold hydrolase [Ardenticatenaceae bacterium]
MTNQIDQTAFSVLAVDGYPLSVTMYRPEEADTGDVILISSATAVPQRFYKPFAQFLSQHGYRVVTYDYRGIGDSAPKGLRGFQATMSDWVFSDMTAVVDWVDETLRPFHLIHVGHSFGGQTAGMLPNRHKIAAMVTMSAQSGYWKLQGGGQKTAVFFHVHITFPILSRLFGYMPWSLFGSAPDIPKGVALEWGKWCRNPRYLLGDASLPLERYADFTAPVLAYSFDDDNWGTRQAVDAMMQAYPNVEHRHIIRAEKGINAIGHFGFFRPKSKILWQETLSWLQQQSQ